MQDLPTFALSTFYACTAHKTAYAIIFYRLQEDNQFTCVSKIIAPEQPTGWVCAAIYCACITPSKMFAAYMIYNYTPVCVGTKFVSDMASSKTAI